MPFPDNESLPDRIKKMPVEAQNMWRSAVNSALKQFPKDEAKAIKIANAAIKDKKFAETHTFDAEIFSVGVWNGDNITIQDLNDMVKNFTRLQGKIKPPLKLGHNDKGINKNISDGQPSFGWVSALRVAGEKLIGTFSDVPTIIKKAIDKGRYKRVSAEVYYKVKSGKELFGKALKAVSLLGADIPAVKNLADLKAFFTDVPEDELKALFGKTPDMDLFDRMACYTLDVDNNGTILNKEDNMSEERIKELEKELATYKEQTGTEADKLKAEIKAFKDKGAKDAKEAHQKSLTELAESMVKEFKMTPASRDALVKDLETHSYSEETGYSISVDTLTAMFKDMPVIVELKEKAEVESEEGKKKKKALKFDSVGDELDHRVAEYRKEHKDVSYTDATIAVLEADEAFATKYTEEGGND